MKRLLSISFFLAAALSFAVSCSEDELVPPRPEVDWPAGDGSSDGSGETGDTEDGGNSSDRPSESPVKDANAETGNLPAWQEGYVDIHFINTATGECVFIIMPDGTQMLVDMASANTRQGDTDVIDGVVEQMYLPRRPNASFQPADWINMYLKRCMAWTKNDRLDYVSITHFHSDHFGARISGLPDRVPGTDGEDVARTLSKGGYQKIGAAAVLDENKVTKIIDRGYPDYNYPKPLYSSDFTNTMKNYLNACKWHAANSGLIREAFRSGANDQFVMKYNPSRYRMFEIRNLSANGLMWEGVGTMTDMKYPENSELSESDSEYVDSPNENMTSTVFKLIYGKFELYCGGDLVSNSTSNGAWRDAERPLANVTGEVEVMKANHPGSADGNTEYFLQKLDPQAVIVCNWNAVQPRKSTYERLKASQADVFTLNLDETYAQKYSDKGASLKATSGHYCVRVSPEGETYYIYRLDDTDVSMSMKIVERFGPYQSRN